MMTTPRRVDFFKYEEDYECAFLGALGFSTRFICSQTKLSPGKITYRLKKAHVRRMDYRDGYSEISSIMRKKMRPVISPELTRELKGLK